MAAHVGAEAAFQLASFERRERARLMISAAADVDRPRARAAVGETARYLPSICVVVCLARGPAAGPLTLRAQRARASFDQKCHVRAADPLFSTNGIEQEELAVILEEAGVFLAPGKQPSRTVSQERRRIRTVRTASVLPRAVAPRLPIGGESDRGRKDPLRRALVPSRDTEQCSLTLPLNWETALRDKFSIRSGWYKDARIIGDRAADGISFRPRHRAVPAITQQPVKYRSLPIDQFRKPAD